MIVLRRRVASDSRSCCAPDLCGPLPVGKVVLKALGET